MINLSIYLSRKEEEGRKVIIKLQWRFRLLIFIFPNICTLNLDFLKIYFMIPIYSWNRLTLENILIFFKIESICYIMVKSVKI